MEKVRREMMESKKEKKENKDELYSFSRVFFYGAYYVFEILLPFRAMFKIVLNHRALSSISAILGSIGSLARIGTLKSFEAFSTPPLPNTSIGLSQWGQISPCILSTSPIIGTFSFSENVIDFRTLTRATS